MRIIGLSALGLIASSVAAVTGAQDLIHAQPPIWSAKPDAGAFEKMENERISAAQRAIDKVIAVSGPRTVANTLTTYDEAVSQIDAAV